MDFGWPNAEIGQKMANGQLLFLVLAVCVCLCVCLPLRLLLTGGFMWHDMDPI